ncbi:RidA family protein [Glutamicibacter soli]|uniref:RidA family protein n=1 Tax=Glutamicibacter soli TaxID=453836 RepID=A0A6L9G7C9_9MICC|nr:Rid family hydrolase [Glutamicibacter soli]NAZ16565.1 RidA family protein [Glutamicibacter soli]
MAQIQFFRPEGLVQSPAFSHAAVVPPGMATVYLGGQDAVDAQGRLEGAGDTAAQASKAMDNAVAALAAAGASLDDVVQWTVVMVQGSDVNAAYGAIAPWLARDEPPLVVASMVAALGLPGALIEISAIAAIVP